MLTVRGIWFCLLAWAACSRAFADGPDFTRDIQPILSARCIGCHGPKQQHGGLRMDERHFALQGGESGRPSIETPLEENELWRRVASNSAEVRMPLEGPRLKTEELAKIEAWAKAGAPWPDATLDETKTYSRSKSDAFWLALDRQFRAWEPFYIHFKPALWVGLVALIVLAILARFRQRSAICKVILFPGFMLMILGMMGAAAWVQYRLHREREQKLLAKVEELQREVYRTQAMYRPSIELVRPLQPSDVRRTYNRGNDERSPKLYNGGFYRTATLDLWLRDSSGKILSAGDACAAGRLELVFDIHRARQAAPVLFQREIGQRIFLSPKNQGEQITDRAAEVHRLQILKDLEHWQVVAPLGDIATSGEQTIAGRLYLIHGEDPSKDEVAGPAHYGIDYKLLFRDGLLQRNSDLWMASLLNPTNTIVTPPEYLHISEWLDFRPIPEIEGEHTRDEKLIGAEVYLEKK